MSIEQDDADQIQSIVEKLCHAIDGENAAFSMQAVMELYVALVHQYSETDTATAQLLAIPAIHWAKHYKSAPRPTS